MRYRRFQDEQGALTAALFTSTGEHFGATDAAGAAALLEAQTADLSAFYGVALTAVEGDEDPWDGEAALLEEPAPPEPPAPPVDLNAFKLALFTALGIPAAAAIAAAGYLPLFTEALNARNWAVARGIVDAALAATVITSQQRTTILDLMAEHHIPEA